MLSSEFEKEVSFDLRASWQVRALRVASPGERVVLESMLARTYEHVVLIMIEAAFPWQIEPSLPCLASNPVIDKTGAIVADVIRKDHHVTKEVPIFTSEDEMQTVFRRLADKLKLSDADRIEMLKCVQRWIVADRRLDPNFDRRDPDARRFHS